MQKVRAVKAQDIIRLSGSITRPADTTPYAVNDAISDVTDDALFSCTTNKRIMVRSGAIVKATLISSAYVATGLDTDLYIFAEEPSNTADNSAVAITDAEIAKLLGVINVPTGGWHPGTPTVGAGGNNANIVIPNPEVPILLPPSSGIPTLYVQAVAANAYVPVSGEVFTLLLDVRLD